MVLNQEDNTTDKSKRGMVVVWLERETTCRYPCKLEWNKGKGRN